MMKFFATAMVIMVGASAFVVSEPPPRSVPLPIVMYHSVYNTPSTYIVTPKQLEADFCAILSAGFTPVFMSEVIDFVDGVGDLPEKPIVITFDDGQYNNLYYALPIAKKLGMKFMINHVTGFTERDTKNNSANHPQYSYLTWEQIRECVDSGLVEFGNHTHNMHNLGRRKGIKKLPGESVDTYRNLLRTDIETAQEKLSACGVPTPKTFAYPFGELSAEGKSLLLEMGFRAFLTCSEKVSTVTAKEPTSLYSLGRFNRSGNITTATLLKKIGAAY